MTKRLILPAILIAGLTLPGCQEEPPEPEVTSTQAQATPPPFSTQPDALPNPDPAAPMGQTTIDQIERISLDEYRQLAEAGEVVTVDVRSANYYMEGHIPGAINIPATQAASMIDMLPKGKKIVTYCT